MVEAAAMIEEYASRVKARDNLHKDQKMIWMIDVYSVHRSKEFREHMKAHHPTIILDYVPAGCTGVIQPCDVVIQRPFKLAAKRSYHEDVAETFISQLKDGKKELTLDTSLPKIRNQSVRWLWNAWNVISDKELVKKSFQQSGVGDWNLSYERLTSYSALEELRNLPAKNPKFHAELTQKSEQDPVVEGEISEDDQYAKEGEDVDDSETTIEDVLQQAGKQAPTADGGNASAAELVFDNGLDANDHFTKTKPGGNVDSYDAFWKWYKGCRGGGGR